MTPQRVAVLMLAAAALAPTSLLGAGAASAAGADTPSPVESRDSVDGSVDHHRSGAMSAPGNDRHSHMARMHQQMVAGNPGMVRMHRQMMAAHPGLGSMDRQMMGGSASPGGSST